MLGIPHDFGMLWKQTGFSAYSGQPINNGQQGWKQWAVIEIPGCSKMYTMGAKGQQLADRAAQQAALNDQVTLTCKCLSYRTH